MHKNHLSFFTKKLLVLGEFIYYKCLIIDEPVKYCNTFRKKATNCYSLHLNAQANKGSS